MTGVVHANPADRHAANPERFTQAAFRWFLPSAAVVSALLGTVLFAERAGPVGPDSALAFFLVGWGVSAGLVSLYGWRIGDRSPAEPEPNAGPVGASLPANSFPRVTTTFRSRLESSLVNRSSDWRVLAGPEIPGDETWLSWLPRERRGLGTVGGQRGTGYSAGPPGSLVALPTRTRGPGVQASTLPGELVRSSGPDRTIAAGRDRESPRGSPATSEDRALSRLRSTRGSSPYSEEELDRMFPPAVGGRTPFLSEAPDRVGRRTVVAWDTGALPGTEALPDDSAQPPESHRASLEVDPAGGRGEQRAPEHPLRISTTTELGRSPSPAGFEEFASKAHPIDALSLEATNPVPPHLRGINLRDRIAPSPSGRRSLDPGAQKSVCASCSKIVVNLRMSGPCPKCHRPICDECLREAMTTRGQGWCIDCSVHQVAAAS
jgi:hypothetical protein